MLIRINEQNSWLLGSLFYNEDPIFDDITADLLKLNGATSGQSTLQAPATGGVTNTLPSIAGVIETQPLTGQTTPTTSTVGYLGQVIFDTAGLEWKCTKIAGSVYTWTLQNKVETTLVMAANQSSNLVAGNHVEFDTLLGGTDYFTLSTGVGQADGILTCLIAGTYDIEVCIGGTWSLATHGNRFRIDDYNTTLQVANGRLVIVPESSTSTSKFGSIMRTSAVLTANQAIMLNVESVITSTATALFGFGTAGSDIQSCYLKITRRN